MAVRGIGAQALRAQALRDSTAVRRGQHHNAGVARAQAGGDEITGGVSRVGLVVEVNRVTAGYSGRAA